jgi:hypothetical protein
MSYSFADVRVRVRLAALVGPAVQHQLVRERPLRWRLARAVLPASGSRADCFARDLSLVSCFSFLLSSGSVLTQLSSVARSHRAFAIAVEYAKSYCRILSESLVFRWCRAVRNRACGRSIKVAPSMHGLHGGEGCPIGGIFFKIWDGVGECWETWPCSRTRCSNSTLIFRIASERGR